MRVTVGLALLLFSTYAAEAVDIGLPPKTSPSAQCPFWDSTCFSATRGAFVRSEVWGYVEVPAYATGSRVAPNGLYFDPAFSIKGSFNLGLLPNKQLYLFTESAFWMQRGAPGITNASQGHFDFSKRELDFNPGIAWNYGGSSELRLSAYSFGNLNRGISPASPSGFKDGVLIENRYYFGNADKYDVSRLSFIGVGFYPTKDMVGGRGESFRPGAFASAYGTYNLPFLNAYLYAEGKLTGERYFSPRLLDIDAGLASRPFETLRNIELRAGSVWSSDLKDHTTKDLIYGTVRFNY